MSGADPGWGYMSGDVGDLINLRQNECAWDGVKRVVLGGVEACERHYGWSLGCLNWAAKVVDEREV